MRILVTGAAGHLGEGIMRLLRAAGRDTRGVDVLRGGYVDIVASISDEAAMRDAMRGCDAVIHTATLHKPHVATHSERDFVETNVTGTLTLLQAARDAGADRFIFTSTTSAFGGSLTPLPGGPAVWIDEDTPSIPKNIYGSTKTAAEDLCHLYARRDGMACVILRTSRFFPEPDDNPAARAAFSTPNSQMNELTHRRLDPEDAAIAHLCALDRAEEIGFGLFVVSGPTPFLREDAARLTADPASVLDARLPGWREVYEASGWRAPDSIGRVYDSSRAASALGWAPKHHAAAVLARVAAGGEVMSDLAREVGIKGYHGDRFRDGLYPVVPA